MTDAAHAFELGVPTKDLILLLTSFGKMPTTRALRLISLFTRSNGFVDQIFDQCARGNVLNPVPLTSPGPSTDRSWEPAGQLIADLVPRRGGGRGIGLGEDHAKHRRDHVGVRLGDMRQQVSREMHPTPLMPRPLERAPQFRDEAGVLVTDDEPDTGQAAFLQRGEEATREHLVLTVPDIEAEDPAQTVAAER